MAKRLLLLMLMLWAGYGVVRLCLSEDGGAAGDLDLSDLPLVELPVVEAQEGDAQEGDAQVAGARLASRTKPEEGQPPPSSGAAAAESLLAFLRRSLELKPAGAKAHARVDLLRLYREAADLMASQVPAIRDAAVGLLAALPKAEPALQVAILGALSQHDALSEAQYRALLSLGEVMGVDDTSVALAAMIALGAGPSLKARDARVQLALTGGKRELRLVGKLKALVDDLPQLSGDRAPFVAPLLRLVATPNFAWYVRTSLLDGLRTLAPDDPAILRQTLLALNGHGSRKSLALTWLAEGGEARRRTVRAYLAEARGMALVLGAEWLLKRSEDPIGIGRLVLPGLHAANADVRARAVLLLARTAQPAADVAPQVEKLFAGEKPALWLTGLRALGAIRREPEDQRVAIDLLFVAVRLPDVQVRTVAVQMLLMQEGHRDRVLALLTELLRDSVVQVRKEAVDGLGELSAHNPEARAHLEVALGDADEDVRALARYWLTEESTDDEEDGND